MKKESESESERLQGLILVNSIKVGDVLGYSGVVEKIRETKTLFCVTIFDGWKRSEKRFRQGQRMYLS